MTIHLPSAIAPPKPRTRYASKVAWILTITMLVMALLHLIRIDKLLPIIDDILPGSVMWGVLFVCLIVVVEVFALPFLLGMKLSPLARIFSGFFAVLAPLGWTCLTIWTIGDYETTGQFSSYVDVMPGWGLLMLNYLWLALSYWSLWLLGYDKSFKQLSRRR